MDRYAARILSSNFSPALYELTHYFICSCKSILIKLTHWHTAGMKFSTIAVGWPSWRDSYLHRVRSGVCMGKGRRSVCSSSVSHVKIVFSFQL